MGSRTEGYRRGLCTAGLIVVALVVCWANTLCGRFSFDDGFVLGGARIHEEGGRRLASWFPPRYYEICGERSYRPVVTLTYWVQGRMWERIAGRSGAAEGPFDPAFFKLGNLLLHVCAVLLLWRLARRWLPPQPAVFAALLFGLHPVTTEAVNAVGFREDLLAAVFMALSALGFLRWRCDRAGARVLVLSLGAFVLAVLSKENAFVLPAILAVPVLADSELRRDRRAVLGLVPFCLVAVTLAWLVLVRFKNPATVPTAWLNGYSAPPWLLSGVILPRLLGLLFWPHPLVADRTLIALEQPVPAVLLPFTIAVWAAVAAVFWWVRKRGGLLTAALWIVLPLVPVSGIVTLTSPLADRYCYVSAMGIGLLGGVAAVAVQGSVDRARLPGLHRFRLSTLMGVCLLLAVGACTARRNIVWASPVSLWTDTLQRNPASMKAHANLGVLLAREGDPVAAIPFLKRACELDPGEPRLWENLAAAYANAGDMEQAIRSQERVVQQWPGRASALVRLARMWLDRTPPDPGQAAQYYRRARDAGAAPVPALEAGLRRAAPKEGDTAGEPPREMAP